MSTTSVDAKKEVNLALARQIHEFQGLHSLRKGRTKPGSKEEQNHSYADF